MLLWPLFSSLCLNSQYLIKKDDKSWKEISAVKYDRDWQGN